MNTDKHSSSQLHFAARIALICITVAACLLPAHADDNAGNVWTSSTKLVRYLSPKTISIETCSLKIPEGYKVNPTPPTLSDNFVTHLYTMPKRKDGTMPSLSIIYAPASAASGTGSLSTASTSDSAAPETSASIGSGVDAVTDRKKTQWQNFEETTPQKGVINGQGFERAYYKGTYASSTGRLVLMHGFVYSTIAGHSMLIIEGEDASPYSATTLPILEASAMSLRMQGIN